jgi:hypothetical protein
VSPPRRESLEIVVVARVENPDAVKLVVDALVETNLIIVPDAEVRSVTVVVANVVKPFEINDEVAVIAPPVIDPLVSVLKNPVIPLRRLAKKLVVVALVVEAFVAKKLVAVALVAVKLVVEALVAAKLFVAVALVTVRLPRVVCPTTLRVE